MKNYRNYKLLYNLKSQVWSLDVMIAVIIFLGTIFFFFMILNNAPGSKTDELEQEALKVIEEITSENFELRVTDGDMINSTRLEDLLGNYSDIKKELGVKNEFCIYFEDEAGNVIYINLTGDKNYTGLGSDTINVSNITCG